MEGREYSSAGDVVYSNNHIRPTSDDDDDDEEEEEDDLLDKYDETYVVQVPKDQIYRVPPPENAIFAEARRIKVPEKKTCFSFNCVFLYMIVLAIVITFIIGICVGVADKKDPSFKIQQIFVTTKGKGENKQHEFEFTLRSQNTNNRAFLSFEKGGKASLSFRDRSIAKGNFPTFYQDTHSLENAKLELVSGSGKGKRLPKLIQKNIDGTSRAPIKLSLVFNVPLSFKVGVFPAKSKRLSMVCNLKVKRLSKHTQILSQDCDYSTS